MSDRLAISRRGLLKTAGFLALGFSLSGIDVPLAVGAETDPAELPGDLKDNPMLDAWIRINADRTATLLVGKVELGQGVLTAIGQICADELDIDLARLDIVSGDTALVPDEGTTAGSQSMPGCGTAVRYAAAEARQLLLDMAASRLGVPAEQLSVEDGTIAAQGGKTVTYWDLVAGNELHRQATGKVPVKTPDRLRYIGKPVQRLDIPDKVAGRPIFVQDHRPQGMVHGRVVRPPTYSARLATVDTAAVEAMPGVLKVVRDGSFLGVIAEREEQAIAAAEALAQAARWETEAALPGTAGIYDWLTGHATEDIEIHNEPRTGGGEPVRTVEATYRRPYHMHGSIGPSAAVATLGADESLIIQTHSQSVFDTGAAVAEMLGMDPAKVRCQHMQGSGCYGHNGADDAAADAALLAVALPGRPVRVQWSRADEHGWEPYGSAMVMTARAGLDASGNVLDWNYELWSTPHGTRPGGKAGNLLPARYLAKPFDAPVPRNGGPPNYAADRNAIALYVFPGHRAVTHFIADMPLRVSSTRGLGAYANVFAIESFMDELAHTAQADPVEFRLRHLEDERARDVVVKAAETFGWDTWTKTQGRGRGFAFARYKNLAAFTAVALEVEVDATTGRVRVIRAVAANDSGQIVNPDGVANQIEGGLIQSLSWSLKEAVQFDDEKVLSRDWASYPILTFSEVPPVEVVQIDRPNEPFLGTGEASQGPTAAALANAIFDATGVRYRELPFTPERIKAGLSA